MKTNQLYMNANYPAHSIYEKTVLLGSSWLTDRYKIKYIGCIKQVPDGTWVVEESDTYFDDDSDMVTEVNNIIAEFHTEEAAIYFAQKHFNISDPNIFNV